MLQGQLKSDQVCRGQLTAAQLALIVQLCAEAGKVQGVTSFVALGNLLAALERFETVEEDKADG